MRIIDQRKLAKNRLKLVFFVSCLPYSAKKGRTCLLSHRHTQLALSQQTRLLHHDSCAAQGCCGVSQAFTDVKPPKRFLEAFLETVEKVEQKSGTLNFASLHSIFFPTSNGSQSSNGVSASYSAAHLFPNLQQASLFMTRPRMDGVFDVVHERKQGREILNVGATAVETPLDAVRILPSLLLEVATQEAKQHPVFPRPRNRQEYPPEASPTCTHSTRDDPDTVLSNQVIRNPHHVPFVRNVLEQCFLDLYLRPIQISCQATSSGVGSDSSQTPTTKAWSWLLRHKYAALALELFMLWSWANPDAILIEQSQRFLPTTFIPQELDRNAIHDEERLVGLRHIVFQLRSYVATLMSLELETVQLRGGFLRGALMYPTGYLEALGTHMGGQMPYKKYFITCPLLAQAIKAAACLSSSIFSPNPGKSLDICVKEQERNLKASWRDKQDRGAEIFKEIMRGWAFPVLCSTRGPPPPLQGSGAGTSYSPNTSCLATGYDPYTERYEEWIVLACALAAVGLLERYTTESGRTHINRVPFTAHHLLNCRKRQKSVDGLPDSSSETLAGNTKPSTATSSIHAVRQQYLVWAWSLASVHLAADADASETIHARLHVENWARMIFSTVLDCFESSGVLHPVQTRRPLTSCGLWRRLHELFLLKFPHVFHAGSTVTTLWILMVLEGMSTGMPSGPLPISFFGKEEALVCWRSIARLPGTSIAGAEHSTERSSPDSACDEASLAVGKAIDSWAPISCTGRQTSFEQRKRINFILSGLEASQGESEEDQEQMGKPPSILAVPRRRQTEGNKEAIKLVPTLKHKNKSRDKATHFAGRAPSFTAPHIQWPSFKADTTGSELSDRAAVLALHEAVEAVWAVFRQHTELPVLRPAAVRAAKGQPLAVSVNITAQKQLEEIVHSATQPSFYVLLKIAQMFAMWGHPTVEDNLPSSSIRLLMEILETDLLDMCPQILSRYMRRLGTLALVHSGPRGARALLSQYSYALSRLSSEDCSLDLLLQALFWSRWPADAPEKLWSVEGTQSDSLQNVEESCTLQRHPFQSSLVDYSTRYATSFGSNSLGWRVLETWLANFQLVTSATGLERDIKYSGLAHLTRGRSNERATKVLKHVLSFLNTLSFNIPDDACSAVSLLPELNTNGVWSLVEDVVAQKIKASANTTASRMESGHDLISQIVMTLSSLSDENSKVEAADTLLGPLIGTESSFFANNGIGEDSKFSMRPEERVEEANVYDSGEAVWLEELDAASSLLWDPKADECIKEAASDSALAFRFAQDGVNEASHLSEGSSCLSYATEGKPCEGDEANGFGSSEKRLDRCKSAELLQSCPGGTLSDQTRNDIQHERCKRRGADLPFGDVENFLQTTRGLRAALGRNSPAGLHLFFSFLELVGWVLGLPIHALRWSTNAGRLRHFIALTEDPLSGEERVEWISTFVLSYVALVHIFCPTALPQSLQFSALGMGAGESSVACPSVLKIFHSPSIMEKITLLLLHTCPDVWLIAMILHRWWGSLLYRREDTVGKTSSMQSHEAQEPYEKSGHPKLSNRPTRDEVGHAMLMPRVEASLCVLLYHAGINAKQIGTWRLRELEKLKDPSPPLTHSLRQKIAHNEPISAQKWYEFHRSVLEKVFLDTVTMGRGASEGLVHHMGVHDNSLLHLIGSMTLLSIQERAAYRREQLSKKDIHYKSQVQTKSSPSVIPLLSLHPANFYVSQFLMGSEEAASRGTPAPSVATRTPVIFPSHQLTSVAIHRPNSSRRGPRSYVQSWNHVWKYTLSATQKAQLRDAFACPFPHTPANCHSISSTVDLKDASHTREISNQQNAERIDSRVGERSRKELGAAFQDTTLLASDDDEFVNLFASLKSFSDA